jgi:hypothetical protein
MLTQNVQLTPNKPVLLNTIYDMNILSYFDITGKPITYDIYVQNITVVVYRTKFLVPVSESKTYLIAQRVEQNKLDVFQKQAVTFNFKVFSDTQIIEVFSLLFSMLASTFSGIFLKQRIANSIFQFSSIADNSQRPIQEDQQNIISGITHINSNTNPNTIKLTNNPNRLPDQNQIELHSVGRPKFNFTDNFSESDKAKENGDKNLLTLNTNTKTLPNITNINSEYQLQASLSHENQNKNLNAINNYADSNSLRNSNSDFSIKKFTKEKTTSTRKENPISVLNILAFTYCWDCCVNKNRRSLFFKSIEIVEVALDVKNIVKNQFQTTFLKKMLLSENENKGFNLNYEDLCEDDHISGMDYLRELEQEDDQCDVDSKEVMKKLSMKSIE